MTLVSRIYSRREGKWFARGAQQAPRFFLSSFFCQLRRRQELEGIRIVLLRLLASPCSNSKFYSNYRVFALHGDFFEKLDSNSFSGRTRLKTSRASASFLKKNYLFIYKKPDVLAYFTFFLSPRLFQSHSPLSCQARSQKVNCRIFFSNIAFSIVLLCDESPQ